MTGLSVLEADNPATKSLIIHKNELENAIQRTCKSDFYPHQIESWSGHRLTAWVTCL